MALDLSPSGQIDFFFFFLFFCFGNLYLESVFRRKCMCGRPNDLHFLRVLNTLLQAGPFPAGKSREQMFLDRT